MVSRLWLCVVGLAACWFGLCLSGCLCNWGVAFILDFGWCWLCCFICLVVWVCWFGLLSFVGWLIASAFVCLRWYTCAAFTGCRGCAVSVDCGNLFGF